MTKRLRRKYGSFWPFILGLVFLLLVFFIGVYGYMTIEGWGYLDSLYMVVISLATVGFQEVHPLSDPGRIFTVVLILMGVGNFAFLIGSFTQILVEGRLQAVWGRHMVQKSIDRMKNHIIVCGYGQIGSIAVREIMLEGLPVVVMQGRAHYYEGYSMSRIGLPIRVMRLLGVENLIVTNAAGGLNMVYSAGDVMVIRDHINLAARNPLVGRNDDRLGPRFPDMSTVYPAELRDLARRIGHRVGVELREGVYAWFLGPSYETPAEVQMAKALGADLVGMSTVPEAIAARHMGARVLGISLVTNLAAGISPTPLSHEEVTETAAAARGRFTALLDGLLPELTR